MRPKFLGSSRTVPVSKFYLDNNNFGVVGTILVSNKKFFSIESVGGIPTLFFNTTYKPRQYKHDSWIKNFIQNVKTCLFVKPHHFKTPLVKEFKIKKDTTYCEEGYYVYIFQVEKPSKEESTLVVSTTHGTAIKFSQFLAEFDLLKNGYFIE